MNYQQIGQSIRKYRKMRDLSQEQLAELVWISPTHMSHIETGSTKLSLPVLVDLARALQVSVNDLLGQQTDAESGSIAGEAAALLCACPPEQAQLLLEILKSVKSCLDEANEEYKRG